MLFKEVSIAVAETLPLLKKARTAEATRTRVEKYRIQTKHSKLVEAGPAASKSPRLSLLSPGLAMNAKMEQAGNPKANPQTHGDLLVDPCPQKFTPRDNTQQRT